MCDASYTTFNAALTFDMSDPQLPCMCNLRCLNALEIGHTCQESADLICHQYEAARWEMARPAGRSVLHAAAADGAAPLDGRWLQDRIASPLGERSGALLRHRTQLLPGRAAVAAGWWLQGHIALLVCYRHERAAPEGQRRCLCGDARVDVCRQCNRPVRAMWPGPRSSLSCSEARLLRELHRPCSQGAAVAGSGDCGLAPRPAGHAARRACGECRTSAHTGAQAADRIIHWPSHRSCCRNNEQTISAACGPLEHLQWLQLT